MDLARKVGEMSLASGQVIAHRAARMAAAGPVPSAGDRREFTLMGQEKFDAGLESAHAMGAQLATMQLKLGASAFRYLVTGMAAWMSLAESRNLGQFLARQANVMETISRSARLASELSHSTARLAGRGLRPLHSRATANAKRLRKG
jgi:hypothetical protein